MTDQPKTGKPTDPPDDGGGAEDTCPFCDEDLRARAIARHGTVFAVADAHPVAPGHVLVITDRHTPDFFTMTPRERRDADELLRELRDRALRDDEAVTGFNVGSNCGASAGQKIRMPMSTSSPDEKAKAPTGRGVKGVIRNKMAY